eukprot:11070453-Karenia_brevis.AAC.1
MVRGLLAIWREVQFQAVLQLARRCVGLPVIQRASDGFALRRCLVSLLVTAWVHVALLDLV